MDSKLNDFTVEQVREYCRKESSDLGTFVIVSGGLITKEEKGK